MNYTTDVIIVGGGVAGTSLAYLLSHHNINVILLDKNSRQASVQLGESLPPSAIPMLERLGLSSFFQTGDHFKSWGYQSVWGGSNMIKHSFDHFPDKYGWKLDKAAFVQDLLEKSKVRVINCEQVKQVVELENGMKLVITDEGDQEIDLTSKWAVDATGRKSLLTKKLGGERFHSDELVAYCCNLNQEESLEKEYPVLIESFVKGWGIVSKLNNNKNSLTIFTSPRSGLGNQCKKLTGWESLLKETNYIKKFLTEEDAAVFSTTAGSSIAVNMNGKCWVAIGDAAMSFDPLSSHGVTTALYAAEQISKLILNGVNAGKEIDFRSYVFNMRSIYQSYLKERKRIYGLEKRWKDSVFWSSR